MIRFIPGVYHFEASFQRSSAFYVGVSGYILKNLLTHSVP
ncbi:hypothetical protein E2C01_068745 [Portunus trituberculatus]|uniref:Uncharacterized protein n=1 Tax=Portunus trituberculatus TaxID=210409 RepID=A0A5B7HYQ7_PORTR|nr:hypothetical protein [Portunus trituberculatus]